MKQLLIISFILFFITEKNISQNISGKAIYKKVMYSSFPKNKDQKVKPESVKFVQMIKDNLKDVNFILIFNNDESVFKVEEILDLDKKRPLKLAINFGGGRGIFYTNLKTNKVIQQAEGFGELFKIKEDLNAIKWTITGKTDYIDSLFCKQAITKMKQSINGKERKIRVEAWFSDEIPYGFGPIGFGNLPGLIVKLNLENGFQFILKNYNIKSGKKIIIKKPKKGIEITRDDFISLGIKSTKKLRQNNLR